MSLVEISLFSLPIKESEIIDFFFVLGASLKDKVLKIMTVQKQTLARQWTRFKVFVASRDYNGHAVLGIKCSMVATAIHGAIVLARFSIVPVRRGYWRNKIHKPHTMPRKVTCCCGCASAPHPCPEALALSQPLCPRSYDDGWYL